jgi:hypothetical protein
MGKRLVKLKIDNMNLQENINRIHEMMFEQKNDSKINDANNTKKILFKLIDKKVEGADLYEDGWGLRLIFKKENPLEINIRHKVVIHIDKDENLWYNYNFFDTIFKYLSLDVIENQHYITEWVEDTFQKEVKNTKRSWSRLMW